MSGLERREPRPAPEEPPADEEYARAWAAGYEEGVRTALREIVQHASRGHTSAELRMLAESRLARLSEEAEVKRRGLLGPPRRTTWGPRPRVPPADGARASPPTATAPPVAAGESVLVREERPARAIDLVAAAAGAFGRLVVVSLHAPALAAPSGRPRIDLAPRSGAGPPAGGASGGLSELGGRLREPLAAPGGALVYLDCLEYFVAEEGAETVIRFAHWLVGEAKTSGSALVVSFDPRALDLKDASRLERAFLRVA